MGLPTGSEIGMVMYYVLVVASVAGLADLRRRTRIWPLLAVPNSVSSVTRLLRTVSEPPVAR